MSADSLWLLGAASILAGAIASVSGFGIGSVLTPVLMLSMPAAHAVAIASIPHAIATAIRCLSLRRAVDTVTFRQFGIASGIGGLAGAALQASVASPILTSILAVLLIMSGLSELLRRRVPLPPTPRWRLVGGALSGFFGGLVGNQGGIRAAALLGFQLPPRAMVATATATALIVDAARMPIYLSIEHTAIVAGTRVWVVASAGAILGTVIGMPLLRWIPETTYRRLIGAFLVVLGLSLLVLMA